MSQKYPARGRLHIPPRLARELRQSLPVLSDWRPCITGADAARLLGVTQRTVERWEIENAPLYAGWSYVGVAFRLGRTPAAQEALDILAQLPLPGSAVWGRDPDKEV